MADSEEELDPITVPDCVCRLSLDDLECIVSPSVTRSNHGIDLYTSLLFHLWRKR